jgi:hypothetical protein
LEDLARYRNKFYTDTCTHSNLLLGGTGVTIEFSLEKLLPGLDMATTLFKPILLQEMTLLYPMVCRWVAFLYRTPIGRVCVHERNMIDSLESTLVAGAASYST